MDDLYVPVYEKHDPYSLSDWINYLSHGEIDLLAGLARSLPDFPTVVNIGAGAGTSALAFLSARPDLHLLTVDITYAVNLYGGIENEMGILKAAGLLDWNRYRYHHGDSVAFGQSYMNAPLLDLVFVDGGHEEEECRGDIQAWWPHLKMGGVMAIHDYRKTESYARQHPGEEITKELLERLIKPYPGVNLTTEELLASGKCETIAVVDTLIAVRKVGE